MAHKKVDQDVLKALETLRSLEAPPFILETALSESLIPIASASLIRPRAKALMQLFDIFSNFAEVRNEDLGLVMAALFDLLVGLDYIENYFQNRITKHNNTVDAFVCGKKLFITFVNVCPQCLIENKGLVEAKGGHKPQSAHIGEASSQILMFLLSLLISKRSNEPAVNALVARKTSATIDAVLLFPQKHRILLGEIKASPLVTYPAMLSVPPTVEATILERHHEKANVRVENIKEVALVMQDGTALSLGHPPKGSNQSYLGWTYEHLASNLKSEHINVYIKNWKELYYMYKSGRTSREQPLKFFFTHGSGKPASDSKNAPGFDRTDDIKKATYQLIKISAEHLLEGGTKQISVGVFSNLGPTKHFDAYLKDILNVALFKPSQYGLSITDYKTPRVFWRYLYDAILTFNYQFFNDKVIEEILGTFLKPSPRAKDDQ
ncbi:MAG: hypothetical protein GXO35_02460 [Gammaproteobacteria bacterium]|nr:hypothetical protein [Gammaproteobacteria bacterium]